MALPRGDTGPPCRLRPGEFGGSVKNSTHKRWKGHCLMCASNTGKIKGHGRRWRDPFAVQKKIGKSRRLTRKDLGDYDS